MKARMIVILLAALSLHGQDMNYYQGAVLRNFFVPESNPAQLAAVQGMRIDLSQDRTSAGVYSGSAEFVTPGLSLGRVWTDSTQYYRGAVAMSVTSGIKVGAAYSEGSGEWTWGLLVQPLDNVVFGVRGTPFGDSPHLYPSAAFRVPGSRIALGYEGFIQGGSAEPADAAERYFVSTEVLRGIQAGAQYTAGSGDILISAGFSLGRIFMSAGTNSGTGSSGVRMSLYSRQLRRTSAVPVVHRLTLEGDYPEELQNTRMQGHHFNDLIASLDAFGRAGDTRALFISVKPFTMGFVQLLEFQEALQAVRDAGKKVYLYGGTGNLITLMLRSSSDGHWVYPVGTYNLRGLKSRRLYLKTFLDSLGIDAEVSRIAEYKTAPENYMMDRMSEENRSMLEGFLGMLQDAVIGRISSGMDISADSVKQLISGGPYTISEAEEYGLVTGTVYPDEIEDRLAGELGVRKVRIASLDEYSPDKGHSDTWDREPTTHNIAVIYASGSIMEGRGSAGVIGAETLNARIRAAMKDSFVKAVVLRVDSPGGSASASEMIRRQLELLRKGEDGKNGKPVVVSMANYAASGGYYISAEADYIYTEPGTLTGSIGIYRVGFSIPRLLKKFHLVPQSVVTDSNAFYSDIYYPESSGEREFNYRSIESFYDRFTGMVAAGRGLEEGAIDTLAGGRVWSGKDAVERGLADATGGLDDAVKKAAELADIKEDRIRAAYFYPYPGYRNRGMSIGGTLMKLIEPYEKLMNSGDIRAAFLYPEGSILYYSPYTVELTEED